jgi:hypothetical protein
MHHVAQRLADIARAESSLRDLFMRLGLSARTTERVIETAKRRSPEQVPAIPMWVVRPSGDGKRSLKPSKNKKSLGHALADGTNHSGIDFSSTERS